MPRKSGDVACNKGTYLPIIAPGVPKITNSYCKAISEAPNTALLGIVVHGKTPERRAQAQRNRARKKVGQSNRWINPEPLISDLLGNAQAIKAVQRPYNCSMVKLITAESPKLQLNYDVSQPYKFHHDPKQPIHRLIEVTGVDQTLSRKTKQPLIAHIDRYTPVFEREVRPQDIFMYHSKRGLTKYAPDVLLECLGISWELHRPFIQKSGTLTELLIKATNPQPETYYRNKLCEVLERYISTSDTYSNHYRDLSHRLAKEGTVQCIGPNKDQFVEKRVNNMVVIKLDVTDPLITQQAFAVALGNLYHQDLELGRVDPGAVLAAAHVLRFKELQRGCMSIMLRTISPTNVAQYYNCAKKYGDYEVYHSCERWLELNLIPKMMSEVKLRQLPPSLLHKVLHSQRLFTYSEYSPYKIAAIYVFLRLLPRLPLLPIYSSVVTYFNSLPKHASLLEQDTGRDYTLLFTAVRLNGINNINHLDDMRKMNILPEKWMVNLLAEQFHSIHDGGDMVNRRKFESGAVRRGFIVNADPQYHSDVMSLHGFHFELKAIKQQKGTYDIFMERLAPGDPMLSLRQCDKQTFSLRSTRVVHYSIRAQYISDLTQHHYVTTPVYTHIFGFDKDSCRSEVLTLKNIVPPLYVTFSFLFPSC